MSKQCASYFLYETSRYDNRQNANTESLLYNRRHFKYKELCYKIKNIYKYSESVLFNKCLYCTVMGIYNIVCKQIYTNTY